MDAISFLLKRVVHQEGSQYVVDQANKHLVAVESAREQIASLEADYTLDAPDAPEAPVAEEAPVAAGSLVMRQEAKGD